MPPIKVPQKDGNIIVRTNGEEPVNYSVSDHTVNVGEDKVANFLATVPGATEAPKSGAKKES